ncbi:ABC transporter ATP-binding protein OS=Streptomyces tendae OX=1932 GN=GUR47_27865 PE=3 SV=1 [Streptomyces tendae]
MDIAGRKPDKQWLDSVIQMIGLSGRLGHRPSQPSGGQQQRVAVARALASRPGDRSSVTSRPETLTRVSRRRGARLLCNSVRELGQTVVMVTEITRWPLVYADRVVFLADGSHIVHEAGTARPTCPPA